MEKVSNVKKERLKELDLKASKLSRKISDAVMDVLEYESPHLEILAISYSLSGLLSFLVADEKEKVEDFIECSSFCCMSILSSMLSAYSANKHEKIYYSLRDLIRIMEKKGIGIDDPLFSSGGLDG